MTVGYAAEQLVYSIETGAGIRIVALPLEEDAAQEFSKFDFQRLNVTFRSPWVPIINLDETKLRQIMVLLAAESSREHFTPVLDDPYTFADINDADFLERSETFDDSCHEVAAALFDAPVASVLKSPWSESISLGDLLTRIPPTGAFVFWVSDNPVIALIGIGTIWFLTPAANEMRMLLKDWIRWVRIRFGPPFKL